MLKIYEYWVKEEWDTDYSRAVIAESKEDADAVYLADLDDCCRKDFDFKEVQCRTWEITEGMVIQPMGYDFASLIISRSEYDANGNLTYYEDSEGTKRGAKRVSRKGKVVEIDGNKYELKEIL